MQPLRSNDARFIATLQADIGRLIAQTQSTIARSMAYDEQRLYEHIANISRVVSSAVVSDALRTYDGDKTGHVDYAAEMLGGRVGDAHD